MVQLKEVSVEAYNEKEDELNELSTGETECKFASLSENNSSCSTSTKSFSSTNLCKSRGNAETVTSEYSLERNILLQQSTVDSNKHLCETIDNEAFDQDSSFHDDISQCDSAIDLSNLGFEKTSIGSSVDNSIQRPCFRCYCDHNKQSHQLSLSDSFYFAPRKLYTTVTLPMYTSGQSIDLTESSRNQLWLKPRKDLKLVSDLFDIEIKNANNNNVVSAPTRSGGHNRSINPNRDANVRTDRNFPTGTVRNSSSTSDSEIPRSKFPRSCPLQNKGLIALLVLLVIITMSTLAALIYFGLDTSSGSEPPDIPEAALVLNQTLFCGKFPPKYIPTGSTIDFRNQFSLPPFNPVFPKNDSRVEGRVVGGIKANIRQYPWQASLWVKEEGLACGGTIIMKNWILTAAHCFTYVTSPDSWEAYMGMSALSERHIVPAQRRDIISISIHAQYQTPRDEQLLTFDYDVALLKLDGSVEFSESIQPICLPPSGFVFPAFKKCYVSGWGATTTPITNLPDVLQQAQVDIIPKEVCSRPDWLGAQSLSARMICAGKAEGVRDACQGDSGGPLSCYDDEKGVWTLAGSVSWGYNCGLPKFPGVYAKMSYFADWIWNEIGRAEGWIPQ